MITRLAVRVHPGARRPGVKGRLANGEWKLAVQAPAEGGRANKAVLELLAEALDVEPRQLTLVRGASSRSKQVVVEGRDVADVERRLTARMENDGK